MELVERDVARQVLDDALRAVESGTGHTVLVAGEAGIGKTSVIKAAAAQRGDAELWWGNCDALQTPLPLAPMYDIVRSTDVPFRSLVSTHGRGALFESVLSTLEQSRRPVLFVIEDAHGADDATLDLLKFLGRRIDRAPCLLVISYRDDEVTTSHPLRRVVGELPSTLVTRVDLPRLSPAAVELLARNALRSPAGIYAATQGNPLFVTELLRHRVAGVPRSVQDVVLAKFARLSPGAQAVVKLAAVVPAKIEGSLVARLFAADVSLVDECLNSGLLNSADSALSFRHELARVAIETSLSEPVTRALHAEVLAALEHEDGGHVSLARLVHHAKLAGDGAAVRNYAPPAAYQAQQRGAHREAAAHYRTALEHATGLGDAERAGLLDEYARECQLTDQLNEAIATRRQLGAFHRTRADTFGEAENLSQLALVYVLALRNAEADAASRRAIELLETLPPSPQLANAYRVEAQLRMLHRDCRSAVALSTKAIELAQQFGHREILAAAVSTLGTATLFFDYTAGSAHLERALQLALADGLHYIAANAYSNLGSGSGELFRLREAEHYLIAAIAFAQQNEIEVFRNYSMAWLALCEMYLGRWDAAHEHALDSLGDDPHLTTSRIMALVALGRIQARRGDSAVTATLDEALRLALTSDTLQRLAPVRAARAEAAFLRGDRLAVIAEAEPMLALAASRQHPWFSGEAAYWLHCAGALDDAPATCAEPFALQIAGRSREAAAAWAQLGCPYERARALAEGSVEDGLDALALFEQLEARPAADRLRRRLRAAGQRGVPRGLRVSTQANPHALTDRELEVLGLLCGGLKNSEIADRLCLSVRTVEHHLRATFVKLSVSSRSEAVAVALRSGIGTQTGYAVSAI